MKFAALWKMSPSKQEPRSQDMEKLDDAHSTFVNKSKSLIEYTRQKLDLMNGLSDELREITNKMTDNGEGSTKENRSDTKDKKDAPKGNTKIKVVVPICTDVVETVQKTPRKKLQKKSVPRGKKCYDDTLISLAKKYNVQKLSKNLDPIKYLKAIEDERVDKFLGVKQNTVNSEDDSEIDEMFIPVQKCKGCSSSEQSPLTLPHIENQSEVCTINIPGKRVSCENCQQKAIREYADSIKKRKESNLSTKLKNRGYTAREMQSRRHCCENAAKTTVYAHCLSSEQDLPDRALPKFATKSYMTKNKRILTCNSRTTRSESCYRRQSYSFGFHPETNTSFYCLDGMKRQVNDFFPHREILRPKKVTLQSPDLPGVLTGSFLPLEEISIGFRFRIGKKPACRIPVSLVPEDGGKMHHFESPGNQSQLHRARTYCGHF